jgi:hypothetical protein
MGPRVTTVNSGRLEPLRADFTLLGETLDLADNRTREIGGKQSFVLEEINAARFALAFIQG